MGNRREIHLQKYNKFKNLHYQGYPYILPNAHDAFSAMTFESLGFKAIGTTSAGIAATLGYPDGEALPYELMLRKVKEIADAVSIPVSADIEGGYENQGVTGKNIAHDIPGTGAVGINIEDGSSDGSLQSMKSKMNQIRLIKEYETPIFINARTDVYWLDVVEADSKLNDAIERSKNYISAGADCIFVPKISDIKEIKTLVKALDFPVNILQTKDFPNLSILSDSGVARISTGSGPFRAIAKILRDIGEELRGDASFETLNTGMPYEEMMSIMKKSSS